MKTSELTRSFRLANRVLAISTPIFVIVVILLRNANEAVLQTLALAWFFLNLAILLALDERYRRRHEGDQ
jgi:preprotein translocase subunit SecG